MGDELEFSFQRLLIEDVIAAADRRRAEDTQANRRDSVRSIFAAIEGLTWLLREHVRDASDTMGHLSTIAALALREASYQVDDRGRISEQSRFISLPVMIRFTVQQAKLLNPDIDVDFSGSGWARFNNALVVRNRITHPKSRDDLHITNPDLKALDEGFSWALAIYLEVMDSVQVAHAEFIHDMRDLLDKLKSGEPEALALYQASLNRDDGQ